MYHDHTIFKEYTQLKHKLFISSIKGGLHAVGIGMVSIMDKNGHVFMLQKVLHLPCLKTGLQGCNQTEPEQPNLLLGRAEPERPGWATEQAEPSMQATELSPSGPSARFARFDYRPANRLSLTVDTGHAKGQRGNGQWTRGSPENTGQEAADQTRRHPTAHP